jgi:predicted NBD/HSP70 family sugar kinase
MIKDLAYNGTVIKQKERMVFNYIRKYKKISRKELQSYTKLKIATLYRTIDDLLKKKLIKVNGIDERVKGGRPTELFSINETLNYIVSIVVYRDYFALAITNLEGNIIEKRKHFIDSETSPSIFTNIVYDDYISICKEIGIEDDKVIGIGLSCIGPIDIDKGIILNTYKFEGNNWANTPIVQMLKNKFNKKVIMDNIARSSIGGQYWLNYVNKYNTMAYVTVGKGIGVGLISNGLAIRGKGNLVKGLGHMIVDIDGKKCRCGNYGCVETVSTIFAIKDQIISQIKMGRQSYINIEEVTLNSINQAYEEGDDVVRRVLYDAANYFATGIVNFINIVELEIIVIGGELIERCPRFCELTYELINKKMNNEIDIVLINDEEDSVLSGIAMFLLDSYLT